MIESEKIDDTTEPTGRSTAEQEQKSGTAKVMKKVTPYSTKKIDVSCAAKTATDAPMNKHTTVVIKIKYPDEVNTNQQANNLANIQEKPQVDQRYYMPSDGSESELLVTQRSDREMENLLKAKKSTNDKIIAGHQKTPPSSKNVQSPKERSQSASGRLDAKRKQDAKQKLVRKIMINKDYLLKHYKSPQQSQKKLSKQMVKKTSSLRIMGTQTKQMQRARSAERQVKSTSNRSLQLASDRIDSPDDESEPPKLVSKQVDRGAISILTMSQIGSDSEKSRPKTFPTKPKAKSKSKSKRRKVEAKKLPSKQRSPSKSKSRQKRKKSRSKKSTQKPPEKKLLQKPPEKISLQKPPEKKSLQKPPEDKRPEKGEDEPNEEDE